MKRLLCCVCLLVACDSSESKPPEPAKVEAAPAPQPEPEAQAAPDPEATPTVDAPDDDPVDSGPEGTPPKPLSIVDLDPSAGPLAHQLKLHAKRGANDGQRVVLEMGAPWCPPCKRAKALLGEDAVKAELENLVVLRANSDQWGEDLDELGFDAPVIPVYYLLDAEGAPSGESVRGDRWKNQEQVRNGLLAFLRGA